MSQQKTLWAGIAIGMCVVVFVGALVWIWSGARTSTNIATQTAIQTNTATVQNQPKLNTSDATDCREKTTNWVVDMNSILMFMIDTDDTKPLETRQTLRTAQTLFTALTVPECADEQLRVIDASIRASLPLYINWTDALIKGDIESAQTFEDQGDTLFILDEYLAYLEKNEYTEDLQQIRRVISYLQIIHTSTSKVTSQQVINPTPTAENSALSTYKACVKDVFAFRSQVDDIYKAAKSHVNTLETYVQGGTITGIDPDLIDTAYATLEKAEAPICIDEPLEILDRLRLMLNTLKPGFVEIKVELANGKPDAQSYARVRGWIKEINGYKRDLDTRYRSIPSSLAGLLGDEGNVNAIPEPNAVDETLDDKPLNEYGLNLNDFPSGMTVIRADFFTNKEMADTWDDPITTLAYFKRLGRTDTYGIKFTNSEKSNFSLIEFYTVECAITHTTSAKNSSELIQLMLTTKTDYTLIDIPLVNVDETVAIKYTKQYNAKDGNVYQQRYTNVYIRKGNIVVQLIAGTYTTDLDIEVATKYAQIIADRLN